MAARGRDTINARIALEGGKEIVEQLRAIGETGEKSFGQVREASGRAAEAGARATRAIDQIKRSMSGVDDNARRFSAALSDLGSAFTRVAASAAIIGGAIAAVTGTLVSFAKSGAEAADAAGKTATATGLTVQEFGRLQFAAEQSGVAAGEFAGVVSRLNAQMENAATATDISKTALGKLGIQVGTIEGGLRSTEDVLKDVADALQAMPDGAYKSALAIEIFGRNAGPRLLPLLNEGRAGIEAMGKDAEALGLVFTDLQVKVGTEMNDALNRSWRAMKAVRDEIGLLFAPGITDAANGFTEVIKENRDALIGIGEAIATAVLPVFRDFVNTILFQDAEVGSKWLLAMRDAAMAFGSFIDGGFRVVITTFNELAAILNVILWPFNAVFGTEMSGQMLIMVGVLAKVTGAVALLAAAWRTVAAAYMLAGVASWATVIGPVGATVATLAANLRGVALAAGIWLAAMAPAAGVLGTLMPILTAVGAVLLSWPVVLFALGAGFGALFAVITEGMTWDEIIAKARELWDGFVTWLQGAIGSIGEGIAALRDRASQILSEMAAGVSAAFEEAFGNIIRGVERVIGWIQTAWEALKQLMAGAGNATGADSTTLGFRRGGQVRGPGTSTSDSIPIRASVGEFMIQAAAVRHYGVGLFEMLNRMALAPGYAAGGLIDSFQASMASLGGTASLVPISAGDFAAAGPSEPTTVLNLTIGGETFEGLIAPRAVGEKLSRFALTEQIKSAGRMPGNR